MTSITYFGNCENCKSNLAKSTADALEFLSAYPELSNGSFNLFLDEAWAKLSFEPQASAGKTIRAFGEALIAFDETGGDVVHGFSFGESVAWQDGLQIEIRTRHNHADHKDVPPEPPPPPPPRLVQDGGTSKSRNAA